MEAACGWSLRPFDAGGDPLEKRSPVRHERARERAGPAAAEVVAVDADDREHAAERAGQERLGGAEEIVAAEVRLGGRDAGGARELEDAAARDAVEQAVVEGWGPDRVAAHDEEVGGRALGEPALGVQHDALVRAAGARLAQTE